MFESRISAGAIEKLPGWKKRHAKTVAWSNDMEGHAKQCVKRIGKEKDRAVRQRLNLFLFGRPSFQGWGTGIVKIVLTNCLELFVFGWQALVDQTFYGQWTNLHGQSPNCRLGLFQDSVFAGDSEDSKSISGENSENLRKSNIRHHSYLTVRQCQKLFRWMLV